MDDLLDAVTDVVGQPVSPTTPLISSGIIDSFGVILLLTVLEERYGVVIDPTEVGVETMDTAERILQIVESRGFRGD